MSAAPHVLLTNDDGIAAAGLAALRSALVGAGCAVTVMAPEGNRSATSHAITCRSGIRLWELPADDGALVYACSGTPVDCVRIGLLADVFPAPDIVVAGINHGINLGDDVYYSATVGAALEAVLVGCPAIAFSQQGEDGGVPFINVAEHRFELAPYAAAVVRWAARPAPSPRRDTGRGRGGRQPGRAPVGHARTPADLVRGRAGERLPRAARRQGDGHGDRGRRRPTGRRGLRRLARAAARPVRARRGRVARRLAGPGRGAERMTSADAAPVVPLVAAGRAQPDQVGIIVPQIEAALPAYGRGGRWSIWTYGPETLSRQLYRGAGGRFAMRLALSATVPQVELLEPLQGPSIYHEWIDAHGYGLHHLGYVVDRVADAVDEMERAGYELLQLGVGSGVDGSGGFAYFETSAALGFIVEAIERPAQRRPPEHVWPAVEAA
jgi:methylmalonyl-CoA/ethylmalonyl-CoA epimerase